MQRSSGSRLELRGEFDLRELDGLSAALGAALGAASHGSAPGAPPVVVDLSGVTFMDLRCAGELAVWQLLRPDLVKFVEPSWQVLSTLAACGLGEPLRRPPRGPIRGGPAPGSPRP